jgi:hypothetical protein
LDIPTRSGSFSEREEDGTGSLDDVGPGVIELGLLGYLGAPSLPANWRRVEDGVELACSQVAAVRQLLLGAMVMVQFSPEERKGFT